ncbi:DUF2484 family protein [Rhodophyticola sp. CCM32]|uniref:DUF2484 family protein n=1 Tax=Rhodophyticola sp. CCM32 TaxID=2916397 RepID=UPI00107FB241|nr:DUF2484 family protein [Rhodophyticola sp. CCM32]QBY00952.1 DUF2484 family protein [Rhodophyticola sp. CCM32]
MSLSLTFACLWVLAAAIVAMLPMRHQYIPGIALLILSLPLIGYVAWQHGPLLVLLVVFAVLSMFRRPLLYFARRAMTRLKGGI